MFFKRKPTDPDQITTHTLEKCAALSTAFAEASANNAPLPSMAAVIPWHPLTLDAKESRTGYTQTSQDYRRDLRQALQQGDVPPFYPFPPLQVINESSTRLCNMQEHVMHRENQALFELAMQYHQDRTLRAAQTPATPPVAAAPTAPPDTTSISALSEPARLTAPKLSFKRDK